MSTDAPDVPGTPDVTQHGRTFEHQVVVELRVTDGTWEATQPRLDVVGAGDSAPRAVEDMARRIAKREEQEDL